MYNYQLDTFICVEESGSFNNAAEKLYISSTAIIKQINLLEKRLDLKLFIRTNRGLILTESGKSLLKDAKYIVQYCDDSVIRAKNAYNSNESIIRIGTSPMTPPQVLLELWSKIKDRYHGIKFKLVPFDNTPENTREILANLGDNIDVVAGVFDKYALKNWKCEGTEMSKEPIYCAV